MKSKIFKIRFIKENGKYILQIKNFIGIWKTQMERICGDGGCFQQPYTHKDKETLLKYVIYNNYWTKVSSIIEYPTIEKYKL
jgi:hypothetical protein